MIRPRKNQQAEGADHQEECHTVEVTRPVRQGVERILKDAAKLKSNENLGAEHQHAGLVQRNFQFLAQLHKLKTRPGRKGSVGSAFAASPATFASSPLSKKPEDPLLGQRARPNRSGRRSNAGRWDRTARRSEVPANSGW